MHKWQKELAEQKCLRTQRYAKNLNERKSYWNSQNFNYVPPKKISKDKGKEIVKQNFSPSSYYSKSKNRKSCFGPQTGFGPRSTFGPPTSSKPSFGTKSNLCYNKPQGKANFKTNIKGKGKLASDTRIHNKQSSTNPRIHTP